MMVQVPDDLMAYERAAAIRALALRGHRPASQDDAEALLTGGPPITPGFLAKQRKLVAVVRFARGRHDLADEAGICRAAGLKYRVVSGGSATSTAEHTVMLMLALLKGLIAAADTMRRGEWRQRPLTDNGIRDLGDVTVGLIGMGTVAREVVRLLKAFGSRILYYKPNRLAASEEARLGIVYAELDSLLQEADIVSLHARHSVLQAPILDASRLEAIRPGGIVINTGDGRDLDFAALLRRVLSRQLTAGLDVFPVEPWSGFDVEALRAEGLLLTPHIAGRSMSTAEKLFERAAAALDELVRDNAAS
jgi:D-3-phosphoglycerate dehydrogenase